MKKWNRILKKVWKQFLRIKLVDRFLIAIMLLLMVQALIGLFTPFGDANVTNRIDVVMRTTMASIFGYFVSSNFLKNSNMGDECKEKKTEADKTNLQNLLQVKIVGLICIVSILFLFIIRYFAYENNDSLAFIFLFRDFVCSGIGFLIGMPSEVG